jgi:SOS response regulatory protein OraA/RecX
VPTVTALREERRGRAIAVDVDGAPWRTLPVGVAARTGLRVGLALDRERLRLLRRELRRAEAVGVASRLLATRDLSEDSLRRRLESRVAAGAAGEAVDALRELGALDDRRAATGRADLLARRGYGDVAIRLDLERRGFGAGDVEHAVSTLEPEAVRARALVERRGKSMRTARLLASRGFGEDAVEAAGFATDP